MFFKYNIITLWRSVRGGSEFKGLKTILVSGGRGKHRWITWDRNFISNWPGSIQVIKLNAFTFFTVV